MNKRTLHKIHVYRFGTRTIISEYAKTTYDKCNIEHSAPAVSTGYFNLQMHTRPHTPEPACYVATPITIQVERILSIPTRDSASRSKRRPRVSP